MTVNAVDATGLSPSQITALKQNGVKTVGRYLSHSSWKALNLGEIANLKAAGMQIFSIYETNPTDSSYFVPGKGQRDALDALGLAKAVNQPQQTAIYFTVDFDCQAADFPKILAYFKEIRANLAEYKIGAYGSFTVLNYLHQNNAADYWFQTVAWSNGQRCTFNNIYQFQCDKELARVKVDFDNLETADIGAWDQPKPVQQPVKSATATSAPVAPKPLVQTGTVTAAIHTVIRTGPNPAYAIVKSVDPSDGAFKCYGEQDGWYNVGAGWISSKYSTFKKL